MYAVKQSSLRGTAIAVLHYITQVDILGIYSLSCLILSVGVFGNCLRLTISPSIQRSSCPKSTPMSTPTHPHPMGVCLQQQMEERIAAVSSEKDQCLAEKDRQSEEKFTAKVRHLKMYSC